MVGLSDSPARLPRTATAPPPPGPRCQCHPAPWGHGDRAPDPAPRRPAGRLRPGHPGLVHGCLLRADRRPGRGLARHRPGDRRPRGRPHRLRQDPRGLPVRTGPAQQHPAPGRARPPLPGPLHLPAQGPRGGRRAQPPRPAGRAAPGRRPARPARAGGPGRHPLRRHPGRRPPPLRHPPAGHPHHHPRVALPAAHLRRPGGPARRGHGDPGRGARRQPAPSAAPTSPSPWSGWTSCSTARPAGSACPPPSARSRRWPASSAPGAAPRWSSRPPPRSSTSPW